MAALAEGLGLDKPCRGQATLRNYFDETYLVVSPIKVEFGASIQVPVSLSLRMATMAMLRIPLMERKHETS